MGSEECTVRKEGGSSRRRPVDQYAYTVYFPQRSCPERHDISRQPSPRCSLQRCAGAQRGHRARSACLSWIQRPPGLLLLRLARHSDSGSRGGALANRLLYILRENSAVPAGTGWESCPPSKAVSVKLPLGGLVGVCLEAVSPAWAPGPIAPLGALRRLPTCTCSIGTCCATRHRRDMA